MDRTAQFKYVSFFFLGLRSKFAYVRQFATITTNTLFYWKWAHSPRYYSHMFVDGKLTFNLRGCVLSKWSKVWISSVKLAFFLDRRSKCNSRWCIVRSIPNQVLMENDWTSYKFQVFYDLKRLTEWESTRWPFIEMDRTKQLKCVTFFFLGSKVKIGLCTTVCNNRYKCAFLLEMTTFTEILFTFVRRWKLNVEFRLCRFMKMDKIVHLKCQLAF